MLTMHPGLTGGGVKTARPQLTDNHVAEMLHLVSIPARGITRYILFFVLYFLFLFLFCIVVCLCFV